MNNTDKTLKVVLIWIAVMLTIIAVDKIVHIPVAFAQESIYTTQGPVEVVIREPIKIELAKWSAYPSQALKVKIDDPWPARIEIKDEVEITGELKLRD